MRDPVLLKRVKDEHYPYFSIFFDKGENVCQASEKVNRVYGPDTIIVKHAQFLVKDGSRSDRPIVENMNKKMQIVESDCHVNTVSQQNVSISEADDYL